MSATARRERRHLAETEARLHQAEAELERWKERAERAEASVVELRAVLEAVEQDAECVVRAVEAERDRVAWDAADTEAKAQRVRELVVQLERENDALRAGRDADIATILKLEEVIKDLQAQDRDAGKLRRRLQERSMELEQRDRRIRELEAGQRAAEASAPMIEWSRR